MFRFFAGWKEDGLADARYPTLSMKPKGWGTDYMAVARVTAKRWFSSWKVRVGV
jgi:hypothetical protein